MNLQHSDEFAQATRRKYGIIEVGSRRIGLDIQYLGEISVVHDVLPLVTPRPDVMGVINLRGDMIPLIDPLRLCQVGEINETPRIAGIVEYKDRAVALACDQAVSISEFECHSIKSLYITNPDGDLPVKTGVLSDGSSINLFDPRCVFEIADMPTGQIQFQTTRKQGSVGTGLAFLTFEAGGAIFGLEAVKVFGTVPRQEIEPSSLRSGACLGTITYLGRRIPVMDATRVLGLGDGLRRELPEIVVVLFPDGHLLGLAVDIIQQVRMVRSSELAATPDVFGKAQTLFSNVVETENKQQVFVLDPERLVLREELVKISTLSDKVNDVDGAARAATPGTDEGAQDVWHRNERCLVFSAGLRVCCLITDVVSILSSPGRVTPLGFGDPAHMGFFSYDGAVVPLVSLAQHLGQSPKEDDGRSRVLVTGPADRRVGFFVESVDGIETSEYFARGDHDLNVSSRITKLKSTEFQTVMPHVDLNALADQITFAAK